MLLVGQPAHADSVPTAVEPVMFSIERGLHSVPFMLTLSSATPDAHIRYTLDFSEPTPTKGTLYTQPIQITTTAVVRAMAYDPTNTLSPSAGQTHTYLFPEAVATQPRFPAGFPTRWQNLDSAAEVGRSWDFTADYEMDDYTLWGSAAALEASLRHLPTVSIVAETDALFGPHGMYANGWKDHNDAWEHASSLEWISPSGQTQQINAGVQTRSHEVWRQFKRGFLLQFKDEYGPGRLDFNVFQGWPLAPYYTPDNFDRLILRPGFLENYTAMNTNGDRWDTLTFSRDVLMRAAHTAVQGEGYTTQSDYVHVYLNGLYWGVYNLTEKVDPVFLTDYFGGAEEEWLIVKSRPVSVTKGDYETAASPHRYEQLLQFVGHTGTNTPNPSAPTLDFADYDDYQLITQYIDPVAFADYIIVQNYHGVGDWPMNNWFFVMRNDPVPQPGFFVAWDAELSFVDDPWSGSAQAWHNPDLWDLDRSVVGLYRANAVPARIWQALIQNEEFRMLFADRVYRHLFNDGALTPKASAARWDAVNGRLGTGMLAEQVRWSDDVRWGNGRVLFDAWEANVATVRGRVVDARDDFIDAFQNPDPDLGLQLWPDLAPPQFKQHGGVIEPGFTLTISNSNPAGDIYYTLDGTDPRAVGGAPRVAASGDQAVVVLSTTTHVKARVYVAGTGTWSALHEAIFDVGQYTDLALTELMYHPATDGGGEFIELKNTRTAPLYLGGAAFTDGIQYKFADDIILAPGAFFVLAADPFQFEALYGVPPSNMRPYHGRLSNAGERLALADRFGTLITAVDYDDDAPWPTGADGAGFALVPGPDPDGAWVAGAAVHGSPFSEDADQYVLTIADAAPVNEASPNASARFEVTLSAARTLTVTAAFETLDGTATAGADYVPISGTLTFPPGVTAQAVDVQILDDELDEAPETLHLAVSYADNVVVVSPQAGGQIVDNDAPPRLRIADAEVWEGNAGITTAVFYVTLSEPSGTTVSVAYTTVDGTAEAHTDYMPTAGRLIFAPGFVQRSVTVAIVPNLDPQPNRTFEVQLDQPIHVVIEAGTAAGLIHDDDGDAPPGRFELYLPLIAHP